MGLGGWLGNLARDRLGVIECDDTHFLKANDFSTAEKFNE